MFILPTLYLILGFQLGNFYIGKEIHRNKPKKLEYFYYYKTFLQLPKKKSEIIPWKSFLGEKRKKKEKGKYPPAQKKKKNQQEYKWNKTIIEHFVNGFLFWIKKGLQWVLSRFVSASNSDFPVILLYFDLRPGPKMLFQGDTPEGSDTFQWPVIERDRVGRLRLMILDKVKVPLCHYSDAPEESNLWTAWQLFPLDDD